MSVIIPSLTASLPGAQPQPPHTRTPAAALKQGVATVPLPVPVQAIVTSTFQSQVQAHAQASAQAQDQRPAKAPAVTLLEPPSWPHPGSLNLLPELIGLSKTQITRTNTLTLPETSADFWALLATALPGEE